MKQIHVGPWSTVFRMATDGAPAYFKAVWRPQHHEVAVTEALAKWAPDRVGVVLATDHKRAWMLLDDAGERLRAILTKDRDIRHWHTVLPLYAQLQLDVAPHAAQLLRLGAPDRRAASLASQYEGLLEQSAILRVRLAEGISATQHRRLQRLAPQVCEWCDAIAGTVPDTIQHDDLHDGQVFVRDGKYRILDWGDACVSHPFYSMIIVLRSVAYTFKIKVDARDLRRLEDLYLEPFTTVATRKQLRETYDIARRVGRICRALTWASLLPHLPPTKRRELRGTVPRWLKLFLEVSVP